VLVLSSIPLIILSMRGHTKEVLLILTSGIISFIAIAGFLLFAMASSFY
jgi:hypothetical protein